MMNHRAFDFSPERYFVAIVRLAHTAPHCATWHPVQHRGFHWRLRRPHAMTGFAL